MKMAWPSVPAMFFERARELAGRACHLAFVDGSWREVDWATVEERVLEVAAALLEEGLQSGERVAILAPTSPDWVEVDLAVLACGGVTVPIYPSSPVPECHHILTDSEAVVAFAGSPELRAKMEGARLRAVVTLSGDPGGGHSLEAWRTRGRAALGARRQEVRERTADLDRAHLASIVYTSGTTGLPKGVMQSHGNHLATIESVLRLGFFREGDVHFLFLPLAHSFARGVAHLDLAVGAVTAFARSLDTVAEDLRAARPHFLPAVPRLLEKLHARVLASRAAASPLRRALFDWAIHTGTTRARLQEQGRRIPSLLRLRDALAHRLVFARLHALLGGRIRYIVSGSAPLAPEIALFFHAVGLPVLEGYGLTETTPSLTVNRPDRFRLGTVGLPLDCCTVRLAPDGEILARGPNIALGYHRQPEATAETFDAEGWLHTGDIGALDADGFLRITDRKKDLIKTAGGKYVAPQRVEGLLKLQPHISQAAVIGDRRPYCVALLSLDPEAVRRTVGAVGRAGEADEDLWGHPAVRAAVEAEVAAVNRELAPFESVKRFFVMPGELSVEGGELTPSLKVKRKLLTERYRLEIDDLYR